MLCGGGDMMWKIGDVAKYLMVSDQCVRNLEARGLLLPSEVHESGHRYYDSEEVIAFRKGYELKPFKSEKDLISVGSITRKYGVSRDRLLGLIKRGVLQPAIELYGNRRVLFLRSEVKEALNVRDLRQD